MAGIYVHIPFCHAKCAYCDFYSRAGAALADGFIGALAREFDTRRHELASLSVDTIYLGGGTPSILSPAQFGRVAAIFSSFSPSEFTVEANPEDIDGPRLEAWRQAGVNRISMGVQSMVDSELQAVGRRHTARQAVEAVHIIRRAGFSNISLDLIYGLPGQTLDSWQYSLDALLALRPEHLSAYCLTIEPRTVLGVKLRRGEITEASDEDIALRYDALCRTARRHGYDHYEISNFALPSYRSRHNSAYWTSTPYLGLGPGAHSLGADGCRRYVESDIRRYITDPATCLHIDPETATGKVNDIIFTALRTSRGLDINDIPAAYRREVDKEALRLVGQGRLARKDSVYHIEEKDWLTSDAVIRDLLVCD